MAEIQPPEGHLNGAGGGGGGGGGGVTISVPNLETLGSKRQRRPSVRLGEIGGDPLYDTHPRRSSNNNKQQWKQQYQHQLKDPNTSSKGGSSKTRALTNLSTSGEFTETLDEDKEVNLETVAIGSWKVKDSKKRALKRVRSNWASKIDDNGGGGGAGGGNSVEGDEKYSGDGEDMEDTYRDFDVENSESPLKEQSPIHSLENLGDGNERNDREMYFNRRAIRARDNHHHTHHGVELSGPSDTDTRDYRQNERGGGGGEDGVKIWLNSIGLGRYAPVFEIHEVDDEVLPMLTLEDLKDMGISAVGSRRKMFCAIQKLGKGFS